jgi:hypothetical protein
MARTDIARVVARAVLQDRAEAVDTTYEDGGLSEFINALLRDAVSVKRRPDRLDRPGAVIRIYPIGE